MKINNNHLGQLFLVISPIEAQCNMIDLLWMVTIIKFYYNIILTKVVEFTVSFHIIIVATEDCTCVSKTYRFNKHIINPV